MAADFAPLALGTAYACLGVSGLRLTRLEGRGLGWARLCAAGVISALLEWYALYDTAFGTRQPNDLTGSLLALAALVAWAEFSRRAMARRFSLAVWAQVGLGLVVLGSAVAAFVVYDQSAAGTFHQGIYQRLVFTQRSAGLLMAALTLAVILPGPWRDARWTRLAGLSLGAGLLGFWFLYARGDSPAVLAIPLVPGVAAAAVLLRVLYVASHRETRRVFGQWALLEFAVLALLLVAATLSAQRHGQATMQLEGRQLIQITEAAAAAFEPANVGALTGTRADLDTAAHRSVSRRLLTIQNIVRSTTRMEHGCRFAYLMGLRGGRVVFLADEPRDPDNPTAPGDPYDEASAELLQAFADGKPLLEGPMPDRYGVWVSAFAPIRDPGGKILALLGIDFDAGDWDQIEQDARLASTLNWTLIMMIALSVFTSVGLGLEAQHQLRRSEHLFKTAADYTSTWDYWVGPDGRMVYTSLASEKITGYAPERFSNHPRRLLKIVDPGDRARMAEHLRACAHDAPACEFDFRIIRKDGQTAWIKHNCESVYDDDGRWTGRRASNRDITALRTAELALVRQERLQGACHQALRRLLGREGGRNIQEALDLAARAGDCTHAAVFRVAADQRVRPIAVWPPGTEIPPTQAWETWHERALPVLAIGESFELLPRETRAFPGNLGGSHIAILPILERGELTGVAAFAAPAARGQWARGEMAALATLASGLSVALQRENDAGGAALKS